VKALKKKKDSALIRQETNETHTSSETCRIGGRDSFKKKDSALICTKDTDMSRETRKNTKKKNKRHLYVKGDLSYWGT